MYELIVEMEGEGVVLDEDGEELFDYSVNIIPGNKTGYNRLPDKE